MRLIDADALMKEFPCTCACKNCGLDKDGVLPCDIKDKIKSAPTVGVPHGEWVKEWEEVPITGGIMHQPYWSCPRCGRKWKAYSAQFITFCSKCGMELIDGDCEEGEKYETVD